MRPRRRLDTRGLAKMLPAASIFDSWQNKKKGFTEVHIMFKILVVEDDKDLNRTVCSFLNASGYQAVGCLDANEAYDAMYENTFDLIVSDIMMPGIDGYEFAKTVRSLNEEIPILFMTARDGSGLCCGGRKSPPPTSWRSENCGWTWTNARQSMKGRKLP